MENKNYHTRCPVFAYKLRQKRPERMKTDDSPFYIQATTFQDDNYGSKLLCYKGLFNSATSYRVSDAKNLHEKLFTLSEYNKLFRPDKNDIVTVKATYHLQYLNSLDVKSQIMSTTGLFTLTWIDSRLIWEKSSYGGIASIYVPEELVWHPALIVLNSIREVEKNFGAESTIRISSDGTLRWEPIAVLSTSCAMNVVFFPFDSQNCTIELASFGISSKEVKLEISSYALNLGLYKSHGDWSVEHTASQSSSITESGEDYSLLIFNLVLKRLSGHYIMIVIFPTILTAALTFVTFFLPIKSGIRIGYILTVVLTLVVLLTLYADTMPSTTHYPSILVALFAVTLGMAFLLVIITICLMGLHNKPKRHIAPKWMHFIVRKIRMCKLKLRCRARKINSIEQQQAIEDGPSTEEKKSVEKSMPLKPYSNKELAEFFDYFCFIVFTVLYILSFPITA
ncbi:Hypothetical predicted protein, partial [Mytilus galloprovincialis]